ncbi:DNA-dependent RNA polymerase/ phage-type [Synechococcus sp. PROS-9-1]|nr:DNA-dependent RNA polymerase/ phage-type [Synechococcus sp. PROS-9-1]
MYFIGKSYRKTDDCERCRDKLKHHGVNELLYGTFQSHFNKLWPSFEEFYREVGPAPGPQYFLSGLIPGSAVSPGNARWLERENALPDLHFWTTTDYQELMKNAGITKLAKAAFHAYHHAPNSMVSLLTHMEQDHLELQRENLTDWQLELETMAHKVAVQKNRESDRKAVDDGRGSQSSIGREFRNKLVPLLAIRLEEHHKSALAGRSGRHHGFIAEFLSKLDYLTIAHITITTVFDCIGRGNRVKSTLSELFDQIGERLDHQAFLDYVKENDPQAFSKIDRYVLQNTVKGYEYKIGESKVMAEGLSYYFMGVKERAKLGDWCFGNFQSLTLWFETYKVLEKVGKTTHATYFLSLSHEGLKHRDLIQAAQDDRAYEAWPMVCPPLDWEFNDEGKPEKRGGYLTLHPGKYSTVIRQNKGSVPSETALGALHNMQNQPFRVNTFIYGTMKGLLSGSHEIGKFSTYERDSWDDLHRPLIDQKDLEDKWDENRHEKPAYKKAMKTLRAWHEAREVADKERVTPFRVMMMAARFLNVERFYLPTYYDSRLRIYYMVDTLNPQGSDYQKALLQFADGNPVTKENIIKVQKDLLITMANAAAVETPAGKSDKLSMEGRMSWALKRAVGFIEKDEEGNVIEIIESLEDEAEDPVSNRKFWSECDEPFQFLAALREYYEIFVWGTSNVARVPNGRDATNSGSQIIGGIIKDPKTCFYCNVTKTWVNPDGVELVADTPQDLYGIVAQEAQILLKSDPWLDNELAKARERAEQRIKQLQEAGVEDPALRVGGQEFNVPVEVVDRKVTKKSSMCTAYGASWRSKNEYISDELDKVFKHPDGQKASLCEKIIITNSAIQGQDHGFPRLAKVNKWFRNFAKACMKAGLMLVEWETPNGSKVVQEYREPYVDKVDTYAMGGAKYWQAVQNNDGLRADGVATLSFKSGYKNEIQESKTETALAANWTHSHDAVIVQNTVHDWEGNYFAVHDCFYGPAGTMDAMTAKARQALYDVITSKPLHKLVASSGLDMTPPREGKAKVEEVKDHPFTMS